MADFSNTDEDSRAELEALESFVDEAENSCDDWWRHGATLIHESHFVDYAKQWADDIGAIDDSAGWPIGHIDWDAAADDLRSDYCEADWDGETYLMR